METKVIKSEQFSINFRDLGKGLIISALTSALVLIQTSLGAGQLTFNWTQIGTAALAGGLAYLFKNGVLEPPKVITIVDNNSKVEQAKEDIKQVV